MDRPRSRTRAGAVVGLVGVGVALAVLVVLRLVATWLPFPPASVAQWLVQHVPGRLATAAIEMLGHLALPLAFASVGIATLVLAAVAGGFVGRGSPGRAAIVPVVGWALAAVLMPRAPDGLAVAATMLAWIPATLIGVGAALLAARRIATNEVPDPANQSGTSVSRRTVLLAAGVGAVALAAGGATGGMVRTRRRLPPVLAVPVVATPASRAPGERFPPIPGLTPAVTPLLGFYVVDQALIDPALDAGEWRLDVRGGDRSLSLSIDEIVAMPASERFQTLQCISNEVGGDLISTTRWTGVPLADVLDRVGVGKDAVDVAFGCADGYSESLPIGVATDPTTLLVYGMDGRELLREHGYPLRVLSLGTYGMKNPKWVTSIEVSSFARSGFWERRGWSPSAPVKTLSRFDVPSPGVAVDGAATLAGIAFAGDRGITRVAVSPDAGRTWFPAELEATVSPFTWTRWRLRWEPPIPGRYDLVVRAVDGDGVTQTTDIAPPHPSGATGLASLIVEAR